MPGTFRVEAPATMRPGEIDELRIIFDIDPPWHMYAPTSVNKALGVVGFNVALDLPGDLAASRPRVPPIVSKGQYDVFEGPSIPVHLRLRVARDASSGQRTIKGVVQYQYCQPTFCLPPRRDDISVKIAIE